MSDTRPIPTRRQVEAMLIARAWKDPDFRKRLIADPRGVIESEFPHALKDGKYPEGIRVEVIEEDENTKYFVIPFLPEQIAQTNLSRQELLSVAFAASCVDMTYTQVNCPPPETHNLCTLACPTLVSCTHC